MEEKKVTELSDQELGDVAGGYRQHGSTAYGAYRVVTCRECGHSFKMSASRNIAHPKCPNCGKAS